MSIEDFKFIYWMECAHRLLGRALGVMFVLPFSYFLRKGYITPCLGVRLSGLFALGAGQGLIGWWMVKSGLEEPPSEYVQPRVSPYRLAAHLTSAFGIYCGLVWTSLSVIMPIPPVALTWVLEGAKFKRLALPGHAFNSFPKMGDSWMMSLICNFVENTSTAQLEHRILATATLVSTRKLDTFPGIRKVLRASLGNAGLQVALGILSPAYLGSSAHQFMALFLLTDMIVINHGLRRPPVSVLKYLLLSAKKT